MKKILLFLAAIIIPEIVIAQVYNAKDFNILPNQTECSSKKLTELIRTVGNKDEDVTIVLEKGVYNFYPSTENERTYYISNHDQVNPKNVGIAIENLKNIVIDGNGSDFIFHKRMLPIAISGCQNITIKGISIDFKQPHITQAEVIKNDTTNNEITLKFAPYVKYEVRDGNMLYAVGDGWDNKITCAIAFEKKTKRIVFNTSDVNFNTESLRINSDSTITAKWYNKQLVEGTILAFRGWYRPAPAIFVRDSKNTKLEHCTVHYAEGMGLLAQMSENLHLDHFNVKLRENDTRYFTTQADATHFSGCKGVITSKNGIYEAMMDDAINVHGTYLKIVKKIDNRTVVGRYMHHQAWGFRWGEAKDEVQFIASETMEIVGKKNVVESIQPHDKDVVDGAREFIITFKRALPEVISEKEVFGIENLTWTPSVVFDGNIIRNNRARGTLFSTPKLTVVSGNLFDHTSGTAILLCGDCKGWFETGACKNVLIHNNTFINSLTNMFQFTNAVISIYPEIQNLKDQKKYFHKGIKIYDNKFVMFDKPILYAKSTNNLVFKNNVIETNADYPAFHWNKNRFLLERCANVKIKGNRFDFDFDASKDVVYK